MREIMERAFQDHGEPLENLTAFRYLGWVMTAGNDVWPVVVGNLKKARKSWRLLIQEGADPKLSGNVFKALTQALLLFRAETWVLTPSMERSLSSFQQRVVRQITGRQTRIQGGGRWEYPPLEEVMAEAGFEGIRTYITRRQNIVTQYIAS